MKLEKVPRRIKTIAYFKGVSVKKLLQFENKMFPKPVNVSNMLLLKYRYFGLKEKDVEVHKKIIENYKNKSFSPSTLAASAIYLYCKKKMISIKLKTIVNVFGLSTMTIHRCKKYIMTDFNSILRKTE